jgi:hypothetical protein
MKLYEGEEDKEICKSQSRRMNIMAKRMFENVIISR